MLALRALLIRASNSAVDYHAYLNQLAALSRRDIAFSVTAQKQKVVRAVRGDHHHQHIIPWCITRQGIIVLIEFSHRKVLYNNNNTN